MSTHGAGVPAPWAHAALVSVAALPLLADVPANINIVATAMLCVYVGARRSVKQSPPTESMTRKDAMKFPLIGSAVLVALFVLFKVLPKDLVNQVLTAYFVLLGTFAVTATALPFLERLFPRCLKDKSYEVKGVTVPYFMQEPTDLAATVPELAAASASLLFCCWYYGRKHWLANNVLGICFSVQGIEHLSLGAVHTGVILLAGLFVYDIFWVFFTPVMVSVAKSFDAPIKLLFPRAPDVLTGDRSFSMLGLGDIVIPGIFVALILRYDVLHRHRSSYFYSAFGGYVGGLVTTIAIMNTFNAAQPALLYIVPAVLGAVGGHAFLRGDFMQVFNFSEEPKAAKEEAEQAATSSAPAAQPAETRKVK